MNNLLKAVLDTHGGLDRWRRYQRVDASIVTGGGFFALNGVMQDSESRRMTVCLHEERASVWPYGAPDQRTTFTPERIAIEKVDGAVVAERYAPRDSFAGHQMSTPWDPLQRAYFNGEALWTYLTTPFLLAMPGVRLEETEPWQEGGETWQVLRAFFPGSIETHSLIQDFFFDREFRLRRHDYSVNIAGGFHAAQLTSGYTEAGGLWLPTERRAFPCGPDRRPIRELMMVSIDISDISRSSCEAGNPRYGGRQAIPRAAGQGQGYREADRRADPALRPGDFFGNTMVLCRTGQSPRRPCSKRAPHSACHRAPPAGHRYDARRSRDHTRTSEAAA